MARLVLKDIEKIYDNGFQAVFDFNLEINDGEFVVFVGPSGCGKSTMLRMIAGLEQITRGEFYIDDVLVNNLTPKERGISMIFQSYALYPHLNVFENMAFGLNLEGYDEDYIEERVIQTAKILGLSALLERMPRELSGGQCQRVAVGRSIIKNPKVFLMDEPLSNLDAKQRVSMRSEIIDIHRKTGATTIYVTHDQTEAMTMADRIVVMRDGRVQQADCPRELYFNPQNKFVAGFLGEPPMNFIDCTGLDEGKVRLLDTDIVFDLNADYLKQIEAHKGQQLTIGFRPESIKLVESKSEDDDCIYVDAVSDVSELLGDAVNIFTFIGSHPIILRVKPTETMKPKTKIMFKIPLSAIYLFDAQGNTISRASKT